MSRSLALAMGSSISPIPQDDFRASWKTSRTNSKLAQEKTFSSMLQLSIGDGVKAALGQAILGVLNGQGLFNEATAPKEFHRKLQTVFGNGAIVLEKVIVKDLFRKLNIPYNSQEPFDYGEALERAKEACAMEAQTK
ncbi:hypothetical protein E6H18_02615 [Candidatus Bathyarchaeota archaeon]|nr:MAG: hypothetical protein AUF62_00830 [archaeon 13_1_20CM_52_20]TMI51806.1 MAG: hypothetical protein E6H20_02640 [Candidatus Bathyarchaeota archaeon]TMI58423.1 MAG: hypothetical protein E6H18_02615 [Candidatus Bathyarchaeota archaeon]